MFEMFGQQTPTCDTTKELIDEEGLIHFYRCSREQQHSGGWHIGYEFGPNRGDNNEMQQWQVN